MTDIEELNPPALPRPLVATITNETHALDAITLILSGHEWDTDTVEDIAQVIRATGREVHDMDVRVCPTHNKPLTHPDGCVTCSELDGWFTCAGCDKPIVHNEAGEVNPFTMQVCFPETSRYIVHQAHSGCLTDKMSTEIL